MPPFALMPTNVEQLNKNIKPSGPDLWAFLDSLPAQERDRMNYAANGEVMKAVYAGIVQRYY